MENIPTFIAAKHGRKAIHYPHPDLETILKDTYGVIVYQEQIMQIASVMAGFSLGQADILRRAVSKKKREVLDAHRAAFVSGGLARGYDETVANEVYDLIVRFADYGFNKSHASAYAVLAYRTSYLRANYLADFLAVLFTMGMGGTEKITEYLRDAKQHGIEVLPPSVMTSIEGYAVESDVQIRTGLLAVRNVGIAAVEAILATRHAAPFRSLVDFLRRVNSRVCNRKAVESLLEAGAFAELLPSHATQSVAMDILAEAYKEVEEHKQYEGLGLFFEPVVSVSQEANVDSAEQVADHDECLYIRHAGGSDAKLRLQRVQEVLASFPGVTQVAVYNHGTQKTRLLAPKWHVTLSPELISMLEEIIGLGNARVGRYRHASKRN
jgi:DNA polymerase III subunit alpha